MLTWQRIADLVDIELMDRQAIYWMDGAGGLQGNFHVQGIKHRVTARSWRVSVNLWGYAGEGFQPIETGAVWGEAVWSVSSWAN